MTTAHPPASLTQRSLLRLMTCGSVDDGKSTLIGRLLHDTKLVFEDQLAAVEKASRRRGDERIDLALLTDGLRAEREQGITIDIAYRYFATPARKFILADAPGHAQYTRNMATAASSAELAIVLVDARHGVIEQTRRHTVVAATLGVRHILVAVNKMDLVGFDASRFEAVKRAYLDFAAEVDALGSAELSFIPISALEGDNVVERSPRMPWYTGTAVLEALETVTVRRPADTTPFRMPVQWVIRPQADGFEDYRAVAGRVAAGRLAAGDEVVVLPGGQRTSVASITLGEHDLPEARRGQSIAVVLADDIDAPRGVTLAAAEADLPHTGRDVVADLVWMSDRPLAAGSRWLLKHASVSAQVVVEQVHDALDVSTGRRSRFEEDAGRLELNGIGRVALRSSAPLVFDAYTKCRGTGGLILIDPRTGQTVAIGTIHGPGSDVEEQEYAI